MESPRRPDDEPKRLAALRTMGILDSVSEERFNRLTRIAVRLFNVPIAVVSLVDENREWFKACEGLSVSEGDREVSFCGHAILGEGTLIIPDTTLDPRFADNPQVTGELRIRFYAGHPLKSPDGYRIGAFCIKDRQPRQLTPQDQQLLRDLAGLVEQELNFLTTTHARDELGRLVEGRTAELKRANEQLEAELARRQVVEQALLREKSGLEQANKLMMGREERVMELKHKINELLKELGRSPEFSA